jgi:hypothetical protein
VTARILTPAEATAIQTALNLHGAALTVDGHFGELSHLALIRFQHDHNIPETGNPDTATITALGIPDLFAVPVKPRSNPLDNPIVRIGLGILLNQLTKGLLPMNPLAILDGAKTYIVGFVCILLGLLAMIGWSIPGLPAMDAGQGWQLVLTGLGFLGLRRAMKTS